VTISAEIILDSINRDGNRITTFKLVYPRFIHAEIMTHRVFSRNAASSRAIPTKKMIERVRESPAVPCEWGTNNSGMQSKELMSDEDAKACLEIWERAREAAIGEMIKMKNYNPHKQIINRLIEPWLNIEVVCTATEWDNFYALRDHEDAQPEFRELAKAMRAAHKSSTPIDRNWGEWHIPFIKQDEEDIDIYDKLKISTARCARVSYLNTDGENDIEKDYALHDRLVGTKPVHASPTEHQAVALRSGEFRNFQGWQQYRVKVEKEIKGAR
jgi:thymidylate synthase ThyX